MLDPNELKPSKPLTGRTVLIALLAFFGVVFAANAVLVKLAIDTLPGTEVDSAYKASLAFNSFIRSARAQDEQGWRAAASVSRNAAGYAVIEIEMRDRDGAPLSGLSVAANLVRPTDKRADRAVALRELHAGTYRGDAEQVAQGQWDLLIKAERGSGRFASKNRIVLK